MNRLRPAAARLEGMVAYDPCYLPADAFLSANENASDVPASIRTLIAKQLSQTPFNRYPDPMAHGLRTLLAEAHGLDSNQVIVGNGGDELLFNIALAWGGSGRKMLNVPPTFSVYAHNAALTGTEVVNVWRRPDMTIDEEAVCARVAQGDIDFLILTSPNNPSGNRADMAFIKRLLNSSDALVVVDEAYGEFCGVSTLPLLKDHENLAILHTFSKAYSLAAVRLGYLFAHTELISALTKVRQPYSVDTLSQVVGTCVFEQRAQFIPVIDKIKHQRALMYDALSDIEGLYVFPSEANYLLIRVERAHALWEKLYERKVLVRDFSATPGLENCLRITIGSEEENALLLKELKQLVAKEAS